MGMQYTQQAQYTNILKPLLWGGVIYLNIQSLLLDSSFLYNNS